MDNAIKYNKKNGDINIRAHTKGEKIFIQIKDTGIGMTYKQIGNIFKPYKQLMANNNNCQGLGMGLYITKKIIEQLGGFIEVESRQNEGSVFTIIFEKYNLSKTDSIEISNNEPGFIREPLKKNIQDTKIDHNKKTLLLVEDNIDMLLFLKNELKYNYNIITATDGAQAIYKINNCRRPDIIISDIMMKGMNGETFFDKLNKKAEHKDIPFIFLTAKTTIEDKLEALNKGVIDYIFKPFSIDELKAKINAILSFIQNKNSEHIISLKNNLVSYLENLVTDKSANKKAKMENFISCHHLTQNEIQVIEMVQKGMMNKEIGFKLGKSLKTVDYYLHNIYTKLKINSKIELVNLINKNN